MTILSKYGAASRLAEGIFKGKSWYDDDKPNFMCPPLQHIIELLFSKSRYFQFPVGDIFFNLAAISPPHINMWICVAVEISRLQI